MLLYGFFESVNVIICKNKNTYNSFLISAVFLDDGMPNIYSNYFLVGLVKFGIDSILLL